jgi:tetratricopeptide (TPR) repeat protein
MDQQQIEVLHQQASEHYLNGRFDEALQAWRQLLDLNPGDERASEGLRLCTLMTQGEVVSADLAPRADAAPSEPPPVAEGDAPDIDIDLSVLDPLSPADTPAPAAENPDAATHESGPREAVVPDASRQGEGIDFGDLSAGEAIPLGEDVPASEPRRGLDGIAQGVGEPEPEATGLEPVDTPKPMMPPGGDPFEPDPVEDQLKRRVRELLTEARAAADEGRNDEALNILSRIAILDEDNDAARELEESLRQQASQAEQEIEHWLTEGVQWMEQGRLEEARERFEKVLNRSPEHMEARAYIEQLEQRLAEGGDEPDAAAPEAAPESTESTEAPAFQEVPVATEPLPETVPLARSTPAEEGPDAAALHTVPVPSAPAKRQIRRPVLFGGILILILAVSGVGWLVLRGGGDSDVNAASIGAVGAARDPVIPAGSRAEAGDSEPSAPSSDAGAPTGVATDLSPLERADRVHAAMGRAVQARQRGDWEAAIVAYNEALSLAPNNPEAQRGLLETGAMYKQEKAILDQLHKARIAFEDGEYSAALRLYYRLPEGSVDKAILQRYIFNGWFNLGVIALRAGDTGRALDHLDEALNLDAEHALSNRLHHLASTYDGRAKDRAYYVEVNQLEFRALDD